MYVDVGAHHPLDISNTAFFDLCLGWKGLCIEMRCKVPMARLYQCFNALVAAQRKQRASTRARHADTGSSLLAC